MSDEVATKLAAPATSWYLMIFNFVDDSPDRPRRSPVTASSVMACLLLILFVAFPRIALLLLFFFSHYLERAYHGLLLPVLGFLFLPLTTLAYAWMMNSGLPTTGINLLILIITVVIDLSSLGGGEYHRRTRLVRAN